MTRTKMIVGAVVFASALLAGCSSSDVAEDTSAKFAEQVNAQLSQIQSDVQAARAEAERANQRLDNLTRSYKK